MEQSTQYATLEEFRKMLAPIAGKALGEAVRHLTIEKHGGQKLVGHDKRLVTADSLQAPAQH